MASNIISMWRSSMALSHLAGLALRTRNECYSSIFVLCSVYVLLFISKCVRVRRCSLPYKPARLWGFHFLPDWWFRQRIKYVCRYNVRDVRRADPAKCDRACQSLSTYNLRLSIFWPHQNCCCWYRLPSLSIGVMGSTIEFSRKLGVKGWISSKSWGDLFQSLWRVSSKLWNGYKDLHYN